MVHRSTNYGKEYDYESILEGCEIIDDIAIDNLWGYSVTRLLPAINKTAYKYSLAMRNNYKLSYAEINRILATIPDDFRHRYTPDNVCEILKLNGYDLKI